MLTYIIKGERVRWWKNDGYNRFPLPRDQTFINHKRNGITVTDQLFSFFGEKLNFF